MAVTGVCVMRIQKVRRVARGKAASGKNRDIRCRADWYIGNTFQDSSNALGESSTVSKGAGF